jgi:hypothetical protein
VIGFSWLKYRPVVYSCNYGTETSGSIKDGEFLEELRYYHLLKDSIPVSYLAY